jgi:hypothetical protein
MTVISLHPDKNVLVPPEPFQKYFWDSDWEDLTGNADRYRDFIICRIADKGNDEAIAWLLGKITAQTIADSVGKSRTVSAKSKSFWENARGFL